MADPEPEALQVYGFGSFTETPLGQPLFHILNDPKNGLPLLVAQPADTDFFDLAPEIPPARAGRDWRGGFGQECALVLGAGRAPHKPRMLQAPNHAALIDHVPPGTSLV